MTDQILDLDALDGPAGEVRGTFPVKLGGEVFELPSGLPVDVLAPIVNVAPSLFAVVKPLLDSLGDDDEQKLSAKLDKEGIGLLSTLLSNPDMPVDVINAFDEAGARLFDEQRGSRENWDRFLAKRPTAPQMFALVKGVGTRYGVGLGEALSLSGSSGSDTTTSKETSSDTSESTSEPSSFPQPTRASSPSDG